MTEMTISEKELVEGFISEKIIEISKTVGNGIAISALSGGVDSATVTLLGHKALSSNLKVYFIDNGLMRKNEPQEVISIFADIGINVRLIDAKEAFFTALKDVESPEEKREIVSKIFYKDIFGQIVRESGAKYLLQGTILTDIEETVANIKRQHNIFEQLGINTQESFGYKIIEPLAHLRKNGVRKVAMSLGLPEKIFNRPPFPGPALATRIIGAITPENIELIRRATVIVEEALKPWNTFQNIAILHKDRVTGTRNGERSFGKQIEVRSWNSIDALTAEPMDIPHKFLVELADEITREIEEVVSVTYNITKKPTLTMEAI